MGYANVVFGVAGGRVGFTMARLRFRGLVILTGDLYNFRRGGVLGRSTAGFLWGAIAGVFLFTVNGPVRCVILRGEVGGYLDLAMSRAKLYGRGVLLQ